MRKRKYAAPQIEALDRPGTEILSGVDHPTNGCVQWRDTNRYSPTFRMVFYRRWMRDLDGRDLNIQVVCSAEMYEHSLAEWVWRMGSANASIANAAAHPEHEVA